MANFVIPEVHFNTEGWGPCGVPEQFEDMPYQPFSKSDKLGKISDWNGPNYNDRRRYDKYNSQFGGQGSNWSGYAYYHEEDESSFQLVDSTKTQKSMWERNKNRRNLQNRLRRDREKAAQTQVSAPMLSKTQKKWELDRQRQYRKWQKQFGRQQQFRNQNKVVKTREASVQVQKSWANIEVWDFARLLKLSLPNVPAPVDIITCGEMDFYDPRYDRITSRQEKPLQKINRVFHRVTTTDDPVIRGLAKDPKYNVFATDTVLSTLMCSLRSANSWDIVVSRVGRVMFLDKRDNSAFDALSVNETAREPPDDETNGINSSRNLSMEASFINHNFSQQVLLQGDESQKYKFAEKNPFNDVNNRDEVASVGYRYRSVELGNGINLVYRAEHDAVMRGQDGELQFINIHALNEWDPRLAGSMDWRSKLDTQRGAVIATELKNNSCKLAKWTMRAILAGSDQIKFGFVSRVNPRDSTRHVILATQQFKPSEFASQINLNVNTSWGILRCVIDFCMKLNDGKYLIMKDPMKAALHVYEVPMDAFENDSDEAEALSDDDDDDDDDDGHVFPHD